jgi:hypothetical protein
MRHDESRLGDILGAAARITQRLAGVKRREFLSDEVLADDESPIRDEGEHRVVERAATRPFFHALMHADIKDHCVLACSVSQRLCNVAVRNHTVLHQTGIDTLGRFIIP